MEHTEKSYIERTSDCKLGSSWHDERAFILCSKKNKCCREYVKDTLEMWIQSRSKIEKSAEEYVHAQGVPVNFKNLKETASTEHELQQKIDPQNNIIFPTQSSPQQATQLPPLQTQPQPKEPKSNFCSFLTNCAICPGKSVCDQNNK